MELWNTLSFPVSRGLLSAFVPYNPLGLFGIYLSADYGWLPYADDTVVETDLSRLDHVWTFSAGMKANLNLVHLKFE
ncbi:MAG: hypothetical protein ACKO6N_11210 [Myxococcota bacterium]